MYYRRWTRMHLKPGIKYFMRYGVISPKLDKYAHLLQTENPTPIQHVRHPLLKRNYDRDLDTKLINNLFLKYPDLQYEPISQNKVPGQPFNTFSYAYSFINEQKKLIRQGYSISKSFELTESKYQEKMQRTLDQSLLSRGLAFGNRARSFLNVYQQQAEYQARLKTQRTKRELQKYDAKLNSIRESVESEDLLDEDVLGFERIFYQVKEHNRKIDDNSTVTPVGFTEINKTDSPQRTQFIDSIEAKFKNLFKQFYEHAATKDRLEGLTDAEIMNQIQSSPSKLKRQTRQLIKYLEDRQINISYENGEVVVEGPKADMISKKIRNNNYLKMALLSDSLNYEKPMRRAIENPLKSSEGVGKIFQIRKGLKEVRADPLSKEDKANIQAAKKKELELISDEALQFNREAYKILETEEERLLRLEIKYYDMLITEIGEKKNVISLKEEETPDDDAKLKELELKRIQTINEFRRLKFRLEKRYRAVSAQQFLFPEHEEIGKGVKFEKEVEFEELLGYLRRKNDDRRLTSLDQSKDSKINKAIRILEVSEGAIAEGTEQRQP